MAGAVLKPDFPFFDPTDRLVAGRSKLIERPVRFGARSWRKLRRATYQSSSIVSLLYVKRHGQRENSQCLLNLQIRHDVEYPESADVRKQYTGYRLTVNDHQIHLEKPTGEWLLYDYAPPRPTHMTEARRKASATA